MPRYTVKLRHSEWFKVNVVATDVNDAKKTAWDAHMSDGSYEDGSDLEIESVEEFQDEVRDET